MESEADGQREKQQQIRDHIGAALVAADETEERRQQGEPAGVAHRGQGGDEDESQPRQAEDRSPGGVGAARPRISAGDRRGR